MPDKKSEVKKVSVQIQEGFYPQNSPLMKEATTAQDKKGRVDEGFVPPGPPLKPGNKDDKGFVPPPPPKMPQKKPDKGKK
jgi:hypothetical protein